MRSKGFTLVELMIVVALIGILASIAYPSYQSQVMKAHRAEAKSALASLVVAMEVDYTSSMDYTLSTLGDEPGDIFPSQAPVEGKTKLYDLKIETDKEAVHYFVAWAEAKPEGLQSKDECSKLWIDSLGRRGALDKNDLDVSNICWD